MKPYRFLVMLAAAAVLSFGTAPAYSQQFLENLRKTFENSGKPQQQPSRTTERKPPKFIENLRRTFSDLSISQGSATGVPAEFRRKVVRYPTNEPAGTIIIESREHYLYYVRGDGSAIRYGVGVGREGFGWRGTQRITRKAEWPGWTPPPQMIERERRKGIILPAYMEGGVKNPLGARALYLGDTLYRIHGSNEPWTIGRNVSSGCFRMANQDVIHLYERASVGAKVIVR